MQWSIVAVNVIYLIRIFRGTDSAIKGSGYNQTVTKRWFTKTIVLVDDTDVNVPRECRRQQLHEMGAVIDLVDFCTSWCEQEVRQAVETAFGGMIDDDKPPPRCNHYDAVHAFGHNYPLLF